MTGRDAIGHGLRQGRFSTRQESARIFAERVLAMLPSAEYRRVLEIGCGMGNVALLVQMAWPTARVTGIDFAPTNVVAAEEHTAVANISFVCADYLKWSDGPFDVILADSVLHLIDAPLERLAAKLAADLVLGGVVVATVPDEGVLNRLHVLLRRLWRRLPPAADRLILALGILLYPSMSRQALADRLPYLRLLPLLFGAAEQRVFAGAGLTLKHYERWPSPSLAKPRHRLMVWRRTT
jgi:trans-aconitate methyltransferase